MATKCVTTNNEGVKLEDISEWRRSLREWGEGRELSLSGRTDSRNNNEL